MMRFNHPFLRPAPPALVVLLCAIFFTAASAQSLSTAELTVQTEGATLSGTLLTSSKAKTAVLIIAGSGPTDRDGNNAIMKNNSLKFLAEALAEEGYATLRYDKRGVGASTSEQGEADLRFTHFAEDAAAWVEFLREERGFKKVVVLGHSEGALLGLVAATMLPVDGYVSLAGAGRPAGTVLREQLANQPAMIVEMSESILTELERGQTVDSVFPMLYSLFRPSVQPYMISWMAYDPAALLAQYKGPSLVVQGMRDIQVGEADVAALEKAGADRVVRLETMNHVLKDAPADRAGNVALYGKQEVLLHEELVPEIVAFLKKSRL
ncbi:MAG: hypothetical protein RL754_641 [Bacteroidota bacterium]|jgi:pimeloyl-ACP methyl ester carboxylesterase